MNPSERLALVRHLQDQIRFLSKTVEALPALDIDDENLMHARDQVFAIRETLDSLDVPLSTASNSDWNRAIGTSPNAP